jgi:hypothetical protein
MKFNLGNKAKSLDAIDRINDYLERLQDRDVTLMLDRIFSDKEVSDSEDTDGEFSAPGFDFTCGTTFDPEAANDEPSVPEFIFTCGTTFDPEATNTDFGLEAASDEPSVPEFDFTCAKPSQYNDFFL